MKILIIHLSDIHIKKENNSIFKKIDKIKNVFNDVDIIANQIFLVVSGDIVFSGGSNEYNIASDFFDIFIKNVKEVLNIDVNCIIIPGNHDCDFTIKEKNVREILSQEINSKGSAIIDTEVINICCKVQENFCQFYKKYHNGNKLIFNDKLLRIYKFLSNGYAIYFNCFNTSWISHKNEKPGNLFFPSTNYKNILEKTKGHLLISVLHHPFEWQNVNSRWNLLKLVEENSDLIITSHEHRFDKSIKDNLEGSITEYIEGGILQDPEDEEKSDFNFILIDLKEKTQDIKQYTWNGFLYNVKTASKKPFEFGKSLKKFKFEINNEFKINFLEDIGASFTHPRKSKLSLGDLYIFPNLRDLESYELKEKNVYDTIVNSVKIISLKDKKNKIMIIGDNKSGKSSLCKMLYMNYYNKNYIPIYIEGDSIKSQKIEKFNKLIENNFKEQYSENKITLFKQTPKKEKYLIIDDIDNSNLNVKFRTLLLEEICKYYDNIIITANNLFQFEDMAYFKRKSSYILKNFKRFEILEFGVILRNKLIRKWNILGREHLISDSDLLKINDKSEQIIDVIIGNNYVPSHPIFLLTILQAIEIGKPLDLQESRYGYYYQLLITQAMNKANITADEQDLYFNYLAELANYLFKQRNKEISKSNFIIFHNAFCEEYKLELNFEKIIYRFLKASLIEEKNGIYRFRYKYIYYFFIAKFISDNITKSDIQKRISNICNKLFVEEYANIIIFLVHHSKDPFILDEIRKRSLFLFKEIEHIKFESDTKFINDFIKDIPSLVLLDKDVEKVRENILKRRDKAEILLKEKERKKRIEDELDKEIDDLGFFSKVNLGIKVLNILGHTLKNYYGSLKGNDKYILAKEAYFLGLRTLKIFLFLCLYSLVQNEDFIKEIMKKILKRKYKNKPIDNKIIEKETQKFLFNICILISFVFIKIISKSIGSENLSKTFKDILGKNNFNAVRLIDISIKLDFMRNLPIDDLKYLKCVFKGNIFPYILLKHLVIDHIYMFPTTYEMKQKISDLFNIPIKSQYTIELYSPLKKK